MLTGKEQCFFFFLAVKVKVMIPLLIMCNKI